jgi:hypothetical protein
MHWHTMTRLSLLAGELAVVLSSNPALAQGDAGRSRQMACEKRNKPAVDENRKMLWRSKTTSITAFPAMEDW